MHLNMQLGNGRGDYNHSKEVNLFSRKKGDMSNEREIMINMEEN